MVHLGNTSLTIVAGVCAYRWGEDGIAGISDNHQRLCFALEAEVFERFPGFKKRTEWFIQNRPDLTQNIACMHTEGAGDRRLLAIAYPDKLKRILQKMLDESEFFSPYGIRSVSRVHKDNPYILRVNGQEYRADYEAAESSGAMFGGNSNWRGPVWFPINYLLLEALQKFYLYFGDDFKIECPTGSGQTIALWQVATELATRLTQTFLRSGEGRPIYAGTQKFQTDFFWRDLILFNEYYNGDNGAGLGASHQTGWTGLVAQLIEQYAAYAQATQPERVENQLQLLKL